MPQESKDASADITVLTLLAAIGSVLAAVAIFQPKLVIPAAMRRETGSVEPAFRMHYGVPQYLNLTLVILLCFLLLAAFIHSVRPDFFADSQFLAEFGEFFTLPNLLWVLLLAAIIGFFVKMNWLSWILLMVTAAASFLPIPFLRGAFGPSGKSAGWIQAWNVCRAWDKGRPLLLHQSDVERIANDLLPRLTLPAAGVEDFAPIPANASLDARANIALFGCILEARHYAQGWPHPTWARFYSVLAAIHDQTNLFEPGTLQEFNTGEEFATRLRNALAGELELDPHPPDGYLAAADDLSSTWNVLHDHSGSVLKLIPFWAPLIGGRVYWLDRRLSRLPMLQSLGMRPQLIKLLARWGTLPWAKAGVFEQPFAKRQGWLLLQENALRVLPGQTEVTFLGHDDIQLTRIACLRIFRSVEEAVRRRNSPEMQAADAQYPTQWDLFARADFLLWSLAGQEMDRARNEGWAAANGWRWRFEQGRAIKT